MRKIICFLVVILAIPPLSAYAASVTLRWFTVRNWKAEMPTDEVTEPMPTDEPTIPPADEQLIPPADEATIPPDELLPPDEEEETVDEEPTTPPTSEEVETGETEDVEQEEQESGEPGEEPPDRGDKPISEQGEQEEVETMEPPDEVITAEDGPVPAFTTPPSTDDVETGEMEEQDGEQPVIDTEPEESEEIETG